MNWSDFILRIFCFSLIGPGIGGNLFVFVKHVCMFVKGPEKKSIDLILTHLALTNSMTLCTTGNVYAISALQLQNFLGNVGCKTVFFLERVGRGLSICTTCLLSVFQAITISPTTPTWTKLKLWITKHIVPCLLLFWICNSLISSNLLYYITTVNNASRSGSRYTHDYCYMLPSKMVVRWIFLTLMALRDIIFQSLMGWSSGYMAFRLYKHHKHVLYLQRTRFTKISKTSPEIRATQSVLILMSSFLFFYWADFIFSLFIGSFFTNNSIIKKGKMLLDLSYATLSPFILIGRGASLISCWSTH
ncbi:PREDICTED: vomeronasal type-1 receptor 4-like [Elephantulus edwardii]|uniref:vomeronasal type-1 receptor 4-like n=1 Tax=Elephantulus edwardii TaxID=28737 RepID=UPI0003F05EC9|nr:PREDICTED: vomeronasal type-1 receptor 4-like [Elephantulus edwardii]